MIYLHSAIRLLLPDSCVIRRFLGFKANEIIGIHPYYCCHTIVEEWLFSTGASIILATRSVLLLALSWYTMRSVDGFPPSQYWLPNIERLYMKVSLHASSLSRISRTADNRLCTGLVMFNVWRWIRTTASCEPDLQSGAIDHSAIHTKLLWNLSATARTLYNCNPIFYSKYASDIAHWGYDSRQFALSPHIADVSENSKTCVIADKITKKTKFAPHFFDLFRTQNSIKTYFYPFYRAHLTLCVDVY